mgnify:CR=1 FL=1
MTISDNSLNPVTSRRDLMKAVGLGLAAADGSSTPRRSTARAN